MKPLRKSKSYIAALLLFGILGGEFVLGVAVPRQVKAQGGTFITGGTIDLVKSVAASVTAVDIPSMTLHQVLNVIAKNTVMQVQAIFLRSLADWVRSGFNGKPMFVTNPEQYFKQLAGAAILNTQIQLLSTRMCRPFGQGSTGGVAINMPSIGGYPELTCTLTNPNIQGFYDKFENGGWDTWLELSQPQNNAFGMLSLVAEATSREVVNSYAHGSREYLASQGFLGIKNCAVNVAFSAAVLGQAFTSNQCAQYANVTPGGIVAAKVTKALHQDIDSWVNVHELSDLIAAFINTALNKLIGTRFFCLDCTGAVAQSGITVGVGGALRPTCTATPSTVTAPPQGTVPVKLDVILDVSSNPSMPVTYTYSASLQSPSVLTSPIVRTVNSTVDSTSIDIEAADAGKTLIINVNVKDSGSPAKAGSTQCSVKVQGATTCASLGCAAGQFMCATTKTCDTDITVCGTRCGGTANCQQCP